MATTTAIDKWQIDSIGILNYRTTTTVTDDDDNVTSLTHHRSTLGPGTIDDSDVWTDSDISSFSTEESNLIRGVTTSPRETLSSFFSTGSINEYRQKPGSLLLPTSSLETTFFMASRS